MKPLNCFLVALLIAAPAAPETLKLVSAGIVPGSPLIRVRFSDAAQALPAASVTTNLGTDLQAGAMARAAGSRRVFDVPHDAPPAGQFVKQICFTPAPGQVIEPDCMTLPDQAADVQRAVAAMEKVAQTQSEKSVFASGLVTTSSGGTAGAADINLNSVDLGIPNLKSFLQIKRASEKEGDPKNFEAGVRYSSAVPLQPLTTTASTITAVLFDLAAKSEGTASRFGVNNIVGDFSASLQSSVLAVGKSGRAKFRIVGGVEGGSNRSKGEIPAGVLFEPLRDVGWIARGLYGVEGALYWTNMERRVLPFQRIEFRAAGAGRHLFFDELKYDTATDQVNGVVHGFRGWAQTDLKLMLADTAAVSYGLKLTFQRGSLPPIFASTRAFQFGFVYEVKDRTER